jgi:SAM-dependent methyltransferase
VHALGPGSKNLPLKRLLNSRLDDAEQRSVMELTKHLDLGCGLRPRNPYMRDLVFGVDIKTDVEHKDCVIKKANLAVGKIPFEDNFFDSDSAYDFLEHIPRMLLISDRKEPVFPFVELMNEIWRVLKPDGMFYAVTPAYPRSEAFADPTHVNMISSRTHRYFTEPHCGAKAYGFTGCFRVKRVKWVRPKYEFEPTCLNARQALRKICDVLKNRNSHMLWELRAIK